MNVPQFFTILQKDDPALEGLVPEVEQPASLTTEFAEVRTRQLQVLDMTWEEVKDRSNQVEEQVDSMLSELESIRPEATRISEEARQVSERSLGVKNESR
jgi:hypothetical protein